MPSICVKILGETVITVGDYEVRPSAPHLFAALLILSLERGNPVSRAELVEMLFSGASRSASAHSLRQLLYRLRRLGVPLRCTVDSVTLQADSVSVDLHRELEKTFRDHINSSRESMAILPFYEPPTPAISRWIEARRDKLQTALIGRLAECLDRARCAADWRAVALTARRVLDLDPLHETATLCLAEALARTGSKHKALSLLQRYEADAGGSAGALALPSRLLKRRLAVAESPKLDALAQVPFIGRGSEMQELSELWVTARRARCTVARIVGEKGIGKSRLAAEFVALTTTDDSGTVLISRRSPGDQLRPYSLLADVSRKLLGLPGAAGCAPGNLPVLTQLCSAQSPPEDDPPSGDACPLPSAVRRATLDLLDAVSSEKPLLFLIEDAQYLDESSRELIDELPYLHPSLAILVVMVGDGAAHGTDGHPQIRLRPLEGEALAHLASAMSEHLGESLRTDTVAWCEHLSGGNPGYLELLTAHASASRSARSVPRDLIALVDAKIAALDLQSQHCLLALAVLGDSNSPATVEELTGLTGYSVLVSFEHLERNCLIAASTEGLRCRSDLVRERVISAGAHSTKTLLHSRAARYLEAQHSLSTVSPANASRAAAHWLAAGEPTFARRWQKACWRHNTSIGQPMAAAEAIRSALPSATSVEDRAGLLDELSHALDAAGEHSDRVAVLRERMAISDLCRDTIHNRRALECDFAEASLANHDPEPLHAPQLYRLLRSGELDPRRRLRACRALMIIAHNMLDITLAREVFENASEVVAPDDLCAQRLAQVQMIYHTIFGECDEALTIADALRARALGAPLSEFGARTFMNITLSRWVADRAALDLSDLYLTFQQLTSADMASYALFCSSRIAFLLSDDGQWDEACHWSTIAGGLHRSLNHDRRPMDFLATQMNVALHRGDMNAAREWLELMPRASPRLATGLNESALQLYQLKFKLQAERQPASDPDIKRLLYWHERARAFGRHDEHVAILSLALASVGRTAEAITRVEEYFASYRRERRGMSPLHAALIHSAVGLRVRSERLTTLNSSENTGSHPIAHGERCARA